mmetsp:Transcript_27146/g.80532  ORF Transcript_27146/g.80532 Transcript_27146/m.80532 type:complete len:238 (-) Transcript_27146:1282-1995(-)
MTQAHAHVHVTDSPGRRLIFKTIYTLPMITAQCAARANQALLCSPPYRGAHTHDATAEPKRNNAPPVPQQPGWSARPQTACTAAQLAGPRLWRFRTCLSGWRRGACVGDALLVLLQPLWQHPLHQLAVAAASGASRSSAALQAALQHERLAQQLLDLAAVLRHLRREALHRSRNCRLAQPHAALQLREARLQRAHERAVARAQQPRQAARLDDRFLQLCLAGVAVAAQQPERAAKQP